MIEITFKDENGNELEQTLKIDADYIIRNDYLQDYLIDNFIKDMVRALDIKKEDGYE